MQAFRAGERPATVMDRIAKGFTDEETRAIAAWLAAAGGATAIPAAAPSSAASPPASQRRIAARRMLRAQAQPRVVVVGGGFGGASCARALHAAIAPRRDAGRAETPPTPPARSATR